jgi:hypothetical protein
LELETSLELLDLTVPQVPPRSRLFHLEPIGLDTPLIESLSGYISRLALEHFTTLHHLMSEIVAPMFKTNIKSRYATSNYGRAINGAGDMAAGLVDVFEQLTLRNDLRFTTMLLWREVFPNMQLIRHHRAWCAACYAEWRDSNQAIYDPLIWIITPVTTCQKHLRYLEFRCTYCNRQFPHLSKRTAPGYCPKCGHWLGVAMDIACPMISEEDLEWQVWVHENVGKLLAEAPKLILPPTHTRIINSILSRITTLDLHQYRYLMRSLDLPSGTLYKWKSGKNLPQLSWLLRLCYQMKISLVDILCQEVIIEEDAESIIQFEAKVGNQNRSKPIDYDLTKKQLLAASEEFPPRSLNQVALQVRYSIFRLKNRFPQLCQTISIRYEQYRTRPFDVKNAKKIVRAAMKETPPPSLEQVYKRSGGIGAPDPVRKHFPKESRVILDRYKASKMKSFDLDQITIELEAALNEWPPCSRKRFIEKTNIKAYSLYKRLPHLWKQLSERYRIYRDQMRAEEHEKIRKEARRIGIELHSKGQYPSMVRIKANFTIPCILWIVREVSKELLLELDYT